MYEKVESHTFQKQNRKNYTKQKVQNFLLAILGTLECARERGEGRRDSSISSRTSAEEAVTEKQQQRRATIDRYLHEH